VTQNQLLDFKQSEPNKP